MTFSPSPATRMIATPVGVSTSRTSSWTPAARRPASASSACESVPTQPTIRTFAPSRAAATAWLAPFPPGTRSSVAPLSVSPGRGRRSTLVTKSRLIDPTTVTRTSGGKCAQVGRRALEILAEVEQAGPERRAVRHRVDARHVRETLQRAHEDGELEVRLRNACRVRADAGALQDGLPLEQLACTRSAVPGAAFGAVGFELEQITVEGMIEPRERGLGAIGRVSKSCITRTGRRRIGIATRPAFEQAAERERRGFARAELTDEAARGYPLRRVVLEDVRPAGLSGANS